MGTSYRHSQPGVDPGPVCEAEPGPCSCCGERTEEWFGQWGDECADCGSGWAEAAAEVEEEARAERRQMGLVEY